jgi:1,2-diacylglycerol 3-alpha-glucosyltransferase
MMGAMPSSMRVLIVTETYLPYLSGVTVSTEALARGLGRRGHDVMLLAPRPRQGTEPGTAGAVGPEPEYAWLPSYQLPRPVPPGYRMPSLIPSAPTMARAVAFGPDVVHAQSPFVAGRLARSIARRTGAPLVQTHHTRLTEYRHYLWPLSDLGAAVVDGHTRRFWASCDAVVAPASDFAAEIAASLGERERPLIRTIPTGIDLAAVESVEAVDPRPQHGWPADAVVAVSLGRLGKEKSVEVLLEATVVALARAPRLRLLLVGGGPLEEVLRRRAEERDLAGHVAFTGPLPRGRALANLKGGDLFVFASQTETQGLVLAEALASGVPVVALEGPGVRDSLTDGLDSVVVPRDPVRAPSEVLGEAIARVAGDDALRATLAAETRRSARKADVDARLEAMEALYAEVVALRAEAPQSVLPRL